MVNLFGESNNKRGWTREMERQIVGEIDRGSETVEELERERERERRGAERSEWS